jgi:putative ABC transport system permease protein
MNDLDSTRLVQFGSRVNYKKYLKSATDEEAEAVAAKLEPVIKKFGHSYETVERR